MTAEQAESLLLGCYAAEVKFRHRDFAQDNATIDVIKQLAKVVTDAKGKFGVMFCGGVGNGKTTMLNALCFAIDWMKKAGYLDRDTASPQKITAKEVCYTAKRSDDEYLQLRKYPILAIDEIGEEPAEILSYGNVMNPIVDLLEYRYTEQLPTYMTTNLDASDIRGKYGSRIADRFNEMLAVIIFRHGSYRLKQ
jgi:DNA replication protein DnaC